jgi:hypothetical protein
MAAMRAIPNHRDAMWYELADASREQVDELVEAARAVLDGRQLTREELSEALAPRVGAWARDRLLSPWGDLLAPAALTGALCFGPSRGARAVFVRADQWLGGWRDVEPRAALLDVLRRYLAAYGPATPQDFASWFATRPATARELVEELGDELTAVEVEGRRAWLPAADAGAPFAPPDDVVRLLPQYDAFPLGSRPRERLLSAAVQARVRSYRRGRYEGVVALSTLLVDGRVTGICERRARGRRVEIAVEAIEPLTRHQRAALDAEVERVGAFLGATATALTLGPLGGP